MVPMAMVHRYVLLLPAFLAAAALHRCGLAPWRIGTEDSPQALDDAIEELTRQVRLAVAADFKTVLCKFVHRYVRESRLQPRVENIHGFELVSAVGLPELRAACREWLIGQGIIGLADDMCDKVIQELHRCRDLAVSESNPRKRTEITETPGKGRPDDELDATSRRFRSTFLDSDMQYAHMHHPTPKSPSSLGAGQVRSRRPAAKA